jgi:hypothetical protein
MALLIIAESVSINLADGPIGCGWFCKNKLFRRCAAILNLLMLVEAEQAFRGIPKS